jgi:lipopolysaccharide export system permease protein
MIHAAQTPPIGVSVPTATIAADLPAPRRAPMSSTFAELVNAASQIPADWAVRFELIARLLRAFPMPVRSPTSGAAGRRFTPGYRTANKLGGTVLYGVLLGFVIYVVTELANQFRDAGVLDPAFAAAEPARAADSIGLTVLLKEDGRAG